MATPTLTPAELQILLALTSQARHGYGIKLDVESRTQGAMKLGSGTLYEAIQRMKKHGWLEVAQAPDNDLSETRRKYYRLTGLGEAVSSAETQRLINLVERTRRTAPPRILGELA